MGILLTSIGAALLVSGIVITLINRNKPDQTTETESATKNQITPGTDVSDSKSPKEIGNEFEGFVADMLMANKISIKQWNQGTTSPEGAYAENELDPDFFLSQKSADSSLEYWLECKYRSSLPNDGFKLQNYQQSRYESVQRDSHRKILIALGTGGKPSAPAKFYIIPLDTLSRFKRVGHYFLPRYLINNPRTDIRPHMENWFYNDVFKTKSRSK